MNKLTRILTLLACAATLLSACGPQNAPAAAPQSWIDAPLQGATIPLAAYEILAHASFPAGISQFELSITGQGPLVVTTPDDQAGQTLVHVKQMWTPPAPGTYLIQVRAAGPDGAYGQMVEAQVHVGDETKTATPSPAAEACLWTADINVFVRQGPSSSLYEAVDDMLAGESAPVVGQSTDDEFWAVESGPGVVGYVPKAERFGHTSGDCAVPRFTPPPAPTPTSTPKPATPECSDRIDNDGDGKTDFRPGGALGAGDPQCRNAQDDSEAVP